MRRLSRRFALIGAVILALAVPLSATLATSHVQYALSGIEYAATTTQGSFAGIARAIDDVGLWNAVVQHEGVPAATGDSSDIIGGTFALNGRTRDVVGNINGGTITRTSGGACGVETFNVQGSLTLASPGGTGMFGVVLTHYRRMFRGSCITFAATVSGGVSFEFAP